MFGKQKKPADVVAVEKELENQHQLDKGLTATLKEILKGKK